MGRKHVIIRLICYSEQVVGEGKKVLFPSTFSLYPSSSLSWLLLSSISLFSLVLFNRTWRSNLAIDIRGKKRGADHPSLYSSSPLVFVVWRAAGGSAKKWFLADSTRRRQHMRKWRREAGKRSHQTVPVNCLHVLVSRRSKTWMHMDAIYWRWSSYYYYKDSKDLGESRKVINPDVKCGLGRKIMSRRDKKPRIDLKRRRWGRRESSFSLAWSVVVGCRGLKQTVPKCGPEQKGRSMPHATPILCVCNFGFLPFF